MKKLTHFFNSSKVFLLILFILVIPSYVSLIRPGFFTMQDDLQAFRLQQLDKCIQDLQIPCRWTPDAGFGYGYPAFNYYGPLPFYIGELFHLVGFQFIDVVKILFVLGFILSAFSMYLFLKSLFNEKAALVGAVIYTYAPYRAAEVYVRGAMGEALSFIFFPLIFWASFQLIKTLKKRYIFYLAFSVSGLVLTHNLSTLIFVPIFGVWCLYWLFTTQKWRSITNLIISGLLIVGLTAFFVLPAMIERPYVHVESLLGGYFDYRQHFVSINQLLFSNYFGYGSSVLGLNDEVALEIGIVLGLSAILGFIMSIIFYKKNKTLSYLIFLLTGLELVTLFLMHQRSSLLWENISVLAWLQFPWRFLSISVFLLSIMGAALLYYLEKLQIKYLVLGISILIITLIFVLHGSFFKPKDWYPLTDQEKFSGVSWTKQLTVSIFDYLPIYSELPPPHQAPNLPEVLSGDVVFDSYKKGSNYQFGVINAKKDSTIRLPLYDFPGMTVKLNGEIVPHSHNNCQNQPFCMGLISFNVPAGSHTMDVSLENTWVRTLGNFLTLLTLFSCVTYWVIIKLEKKKV